MRDLTVDVEAAINEEKILPLILVQADFSSGTTRAWTGIGDLSWDGYTWSGLGSFFKIEEIKGTQDLQANSVCFTLNGLDPNILSIALSEDYQNRDIWAWIAFLDKDTEELIADPHLIFRGFMDVMTIATDGKEGTASINAENSLITALQTKQRYHTYEDQKSMYPNDEGESFATTIEDIQITWGYS